MTTELIISRLSEIKEVMLKLRIEPISATIYIANIFAIWCIGSGDINIVKSGITLIAVITLFRLPIPLYMKQDGDNDRNG
jgi:hypothetical protein